MDMSMKVLSFKDTHTWPEADPWMARGPPLNANHTSSAQHGVQPDI